MSLLPYQNPSLPSHRRVDDLLARMTVEEKAGMLFHDMIVPGQNGALASAENFLGRPATREAVERLHMTHFNLVGPINDVREHVRWYNALQTVAAETRLGIPVTLSTDPRNAFSTNPGAAAAAGAFSRWPETLGLAALRNPETVQEYADTVRQEYLATGLRVALHPQIDLATEPRWARAGMTFGEDAALTSELVAAYLAGLHGPTFGSASVSAVVKHFPGGGPQLDGEDPHFHYGQGQVYPGGRFREHLKPFIAAIRNGARQMMPYYGVPLDTGYEQVAFGFNRGIITDLLRGELGFEGIVLSDWGLITDGSFMGEPMPARAWGVEQLTEHARVKKALDAGVDQFGGESVPNLVIDLIEQGLLDEARLDRSVERLLLEKFDLGLFENQFLNEEQAVATVGREDFVAAGARVQRAAMVELTAPEQGTPASVPVAPAAVYTEGIDRSEAARLGRLVPSADNADFAVLRLNAPFTPRPGRFETMFHAGSLEFEPAERARIIEICEQVPTIIVLYLDRAAAVPELAEVAATFFVEFGADDSAVVDVLLGHAEAVGRLPVDLPRSDTAVQRSRSDVPFDTEAPVFRFGAGRSTTLQALEDARSSAR